MDHVQRLDVQCARKAVRARLEWDKPGVLPSSIRLFVRRLAHVRAGVLNLERFRGMAKEKVLDTETVALLFPEERVLEQEKDSLWLGIRPIKSLGKLIKTSSLPMRSPRDVAVDGFGRVFVASHSDNRVLMYNADMEHVATFGGSAGSPHKKGDCVFYGPEGICVDGLGRVIVADQGKNRLQIVNEDGVFLQYVGEDVFRGPYSCCVDPYGNIWGASTGDNKVIQYDPAGKKKLKTFPPKGAKYTLNCPDGLCCDGLGRLIIADCYNHCVRVLDPETGESLVEIGGSSLMKWPYGVAVDMEGRLYVAVWGDNKVIVL